MTHSAERSRPRAARSWRARPAPSLATRVIGLVGELLLTAGVVLALFLVWQLWWTDVVASEDQQENVAAVRQSFGDPVVTTPADPEPGDRPPEPSSEPPPAILPVDNAETFAVLLVPRWGEDYEVPVAEGIGVWDVLNTGAAGHYPGTAMPGEVGNFALAAHRQSYGGPFRHVDQLQEHDAIVVETSRGWLVYRVREDYIVTPDQVDVVAPVPGEPGAEPEDRLVTLTTCHPLFSTAERWITQAEFDEWYPRSGGEPTHVLEVS